MIDIDIKCEDGKFKYRVCGLIEKNGKFLIQKIAANQFYCLPGGHVELGEDTLTAVKREMREEISKEIKNEKIFIIMENFFKTETGKVYHELGFYYKAEVEGFENQEDYEIMENDKGVMKRLAYKCVTPEELRKVDFRPSILKEIIIKRDFDKLRHIINKQ